VKAGVLCEKDCKEQKYGEMLNVIDLYKEQEGSLIQVLHAAQNIYGHLPPDLQQFIANGLGLPFSEVSGVVSFYSFFSVHPRGQHTIRVCLGTACYVRGAGSLVSAFEKELAVKVGGTTPDRLFTLEVSRCIGACGLAPVLTVNEDVYGNIGPERVAGILAKYRDRQ